MMPSAVANRGRAAGKEGPLRGTGDPDVMSTVITHAHRDYAHMDLRVDAHDRPVDELRRVHSVYKPFEPYYQLRHDDPA